MKTIFRVITTAIFAAGLGSGAIAQAAVPIATSNQQLSAKELLRTQPQTGQLLAVPQPPPAFSTINLCYGSCGGPADQLVLPNGGEVRREAEFSGVKIFGKVQPFLGTAMDPRANGARMLIFTMP
jgi:hypothetical protein